MKSSNPVLTQLPTSYQQTGYGQPMGTEHNPYDQQPYGAPAPFAAPGAAPRQRNDSRGVGATALGNAWGEE